VPVSATVASDPPPPAPARWLYWLVRDLSVAKQAEAERQRLERAARRAEHFALLGRLAAGVSHELRNPLGVIMLHVDLLEEELRLLMPESTPEVTQALTEIKTHLARVDDLLQDYLALVRVGVGSQTPVDLQAFVMQFAQEIAPALTAQSITLQLDGLEQLGVMAIPSNPFRRALLNLVHNAMDAMPKGGTLTLSGQCQGGTMHLAIQDTGSGMSPEHMARIFEPLYTTKPGGTGLGLYLVQEVMSAQGGQVTVQSTVGVGTTMTITLPQTDAGGVAPDLWR
jgi:signal transduction histidine kinase